MDWKRYVVTFAKYLQSSLRLEVYPEISGYTVYYGAILLLLCSLLLWTFVGNTQIS